MDNSANSSVSSSPSLPSLPASVLNKFLLLCGEDRKLFNALYHRLWTYLLPIKDMDAVSFGYGVNAVISFFNLVPGDFWLLSRLWILSGCGERAVNSMDYSFTKYENKVITRFIKSGHLVRTSFDPALPNAKNARGIHRTFISLTPSGVFLYKSVVRKVNKLVQNDILGGFTG
jgi:hypothetical protein